MSLIQRSGTLWWCCSDTDLLSETWTELARLNVMNKQAWGQFTEDQNRLWSHLFLIICWLKTAIPLITNPSSKRSQLRREDYFQSHQLKQVATQQLPLYPITMWHYCTHPFWSKWHFNDTWSRSFIGQSWKGEEPMVRSRPKCVRPDVCWFLHLSSVRLQSPTSWCYLELSWILGAHTLYDFLLAWIELLREILFHELLLLI